MCLRHTPGRKVFDPTGRQGWEPQMPLDMVGEHAEEDMSPHPVRGPMPDRPDVQIDALQGSERPFDVREILVGLNRLCGVQMLGRHAGSDHIDAIQPRLCRDLIEPSMPREMTVADRDDEVFGHLSFVEDRADRQANLGSVTQGGVLAADLRFDPGQIAFGRS